MMSSGSFAVNGPLPKMKIYLIPAGIKASLVTSRREQAKEMREKGLAARREPTGENSTQFHSRTIVTSSTSFLTPSFFMPAFF